MQTSIYFVCKIISAVHVTIVFSRSVFLHKTRRMWRRFFSSDEQVLDPPQLFRAARDSAVFHGHRGQEPVDAMSAWIFAPEMVVVQRRTAELLLTSRGWVRAANFETVDTNQLARKTRERHSNTILMWIAIAMMSGLLMFEFVSNCMFKAEQRRLEVQAKENHQLTQWWTNRLMILTLPCLFLLAGLALASFLVRMIRRDLTEGCLAWISASRESEPTSVPRPTIDPARELAEHVERVERAERDNRRRSLLQMLALSMTPVVFAAGRRVLNHYLEHAIHRGVFGPDWRAFLGGFLPHLAPPQGQAAPPRQPQPMANVQQVAPQANANAPPQAQAQPDPARGQVAQILDEMIDQVRQAQQNGQAPVGDPPQQPVGPQQLAQAQQQPPQQVQGGQAPPQQPMQQAQVPQVQVPLIQAPLQAQQVQVHGVPVQGLHVQGLVPQVHGIRADQVQRA